MKAHTDTNAITRYLIKNNSINKLKTYLRPAKEHYESELWCRFITIYDVIRAADFIYAAVRAHTYEYIRKMYYEISFIS